MRMYQHIGLKSDAIDFLNRNVVMIPDIVCPKCGEVITTKMDKKLIGRTELFYSDGPNEYEYKLSDGPNEYEYKLSDGRVCFEVLQASPWSSGPMGFMCLKIDNELMFQWYQEEIDEFV